MSALELELPPSPSAGMIEHLAHAHAIAQPLTDIVRRLDTPGVVLAHGWPASFLFPVDGEPEPLEVDGLELRVFYCRGCASLHRRVSVFGVGHREPIGALDLDVGSVESGRPAAAEDDHELELVEALSWSLDVLRMALRRIDAVDGETLTREHYALRDEGLAKAWKALDDALERRRSRRLG